MGHIVNPISARLYNIRYWNNSWFNSSSLNYSYLANLDIIFRNTVLSLTRILGLNNMPLFLFNSKIIRFYNKVYVYIYGHKDLGPGLGSLFKKARLISLKKSSFNTKKQKNPDTSRDRQIGFIIGKKFRFLNKKNIFKKLLKTYLFNKFFIKIWHLLKSILLLSFNSYISHGNTLIKIVLILVSRRHIDPKMLSEYFYIRLKQYYTIWELLRSMNLLFKPLMASRRIKNNKRVRYDSPAVKGYKITCSGRFSRKQRTTYSWRIRGKPGFSTMKTYLDYDYKSIALKYSTCTVKIWISMFKKKRRFIKYII